MTCEDPRDQKPEVEDDPQTTQDHEKEIKTNDDEKDSEYRYTDWASI